MKDAFISSVLLQGAPGSPEERAVLKDNVDSFAYASKNIGLAFAGNIKPLSVVYYPSYLRDLIIKHDIHPDEIQGLEDSASRKLIINVQFDSTKPGSKERLARIAFIEDIKRHAERSQ